MLTFKDRMNMYSESNRLNSFKFWPYSDTDVCNTTKLAEAGFFWVGTKKDPDSAQCFVCNKQLDGWEATDDPWQEHLDHSPKCPFILIGKPEDEITIFEHCDLWYLMVKNIFNKNHTEEINKLKTRAKQMRILIKHHFKNKN